MVRHTATASRRSGTITGARTCDHAAASIVAGEMQLAASAGRGVGEALGAGGLRSRASRVYREGQPGGGRPRTWSAASAGARRVLRCTWSAASAAASLGFSFLVLFCQMIYL
jgi:hypothetical protein